MTGIQGIGLFEWADYAPPKPEWAQACLHCRPDAAGDGEQLPPEGWPAAPGVGGGAEDGATAGAPGPGEGE